MSNAPDLRLVSDGLPDKSKVFAVYNSKHDELFFLAPSEHEAILAAKGFDHVRTIGAHTRQMDRAFVERQLGRSSDKLGELLKIGATGKLEIVFREVMRSDAKFYGLNSKKRAIVL